jgi:hypothetical protein
LLQNEMLCLGPSASNPPFSWYILLPWRWNQYTLLWHTVTLTYRYSDIPLLSPSPQSVTYQNSTVNFRRHTLTVSHWQTFLYSPMSPSTVRRTHLLLNLCYPLLCTLGAGLLNAMKRIKLTLV